MWFKNLRIYRLSEDFPLDDEALEAALEEKIFQPCGSLDLQRYGWVSPLGRSGKQLAHTATQRTIVCAKRQEKIIPGAAVNEALENKVYEINEDEGRSVGRKERQDLKDELIFSMMPHALTRSSLEFGYVSRKEKLIYINAGSSKKAEELLSLLRECCGTLKATPIAPHHPAGHVMTDWLRNGVATLPFVLGETCELRASKDERVIRIRKADLSADEVRTHLDTGMHVHKLSLEWNETIRFDIDDEFSIKSLKFADQLTEQADDLNADTHAAAFDNEFTIMSAELEAFMKQLLEVFGGESEIF